MKYLIQQWIEALHQNSQCPRLMIDATVAGVELPERVRSQWGEAMPIDLDPQFPLELEMDERGIHCVLSFGGPYPCHFPWRAIYVVQDRDSQLGIVIEENLPRSMAPATSGRDEPDRSAVPAPHHGPEDPAEALVGALVPAPALAAPLAVAPVDASVLAWLPSGQDDSDEDDSDEDDSDEDDSDEPRGRRAAFRVIDGGKS